MHVIGVAGYSDAGKTSFIERLVSYLRDCGEVATIKSIHHDVEIDQPGKDTYRHRKVGSRRVVGVTPSTTFEVREGGKCEAGDTAALAHLLDELADDGHDYAVVEGFKQAVIPTIVVGSIPEAEVSGAVLTRITDGSGGTLEELVDLIDGVNTYETCQSLVDRFERQSVPDAGVRAVSHGRIRSTSPSLPDTTSDTVTEALEEVRTILTNYDPVSEVVVTSRPALDRTSEHAIHLGILTVDHQCAIETLQMGYNHLIRTSAYPDGFLDDFEYLIRGLLSPRSSP